mgnify:CR=1 FL=1
MSKTIQEAIQELAIAVGECSVTVQNMIERELGFNQTYIKLDELKRLTKTHPQSPYAKFDNIHKKQKRK